MKDSSYFSPAVRFSLWFWAGACATQDGQVGCTCILRVPLMARKRLWSQRHLCWFVPLSLPCFLLTDCRLLKDSYFVSWSNTRIPHSKSTMCLPHKEFRYLVSIPSLERSAFPWNILRPRRLSDCYQSGKEDLSSLLPQIPIWFHLRLRHQDKWPLGGRKLQRNNLSSMSCFLPVNGEFFLACPALA